MEKFSLPECVSNPNPSYSNSLVITKTRLYKFDPLKPNFYIVKLGLTRVYIILPVRGGSNEYPQSMFRVEI